MSIPTLHRSRRARFIIPVVLGAILSLCAAVRISGPDAAAGGPAGGDERVAVAVLGMSETNPVGLEGDSADPADFGEMPEVGIGPAVVMERDGIIRSR